MFRRAQILIDVDYYIKSIPFWRKVVTRKATAGAGKLSVGGFQQWFKLDVEKDFDEIKKLLLKQISENLQSLVDKDFKELAEDNLVNWSPDAPLADG